MDLGHGWYTPDLAQGPRFQLDESEFPLSVNRRAPRIPPELWDRHREEITKEWVGTKNTLEELRELFWRKHLFDATPKQWKSKLEQWNLRRNFDKISVAWILKLLEEANTAHINREVFFQGKQIYEKDVQPYMRKSDPPRDKVSLLELAETKGQPVYVTFNDLPWPSTTAGPSRASTSVVSPHLRPPSSNMRSPNMKPSSNRVSAGSLSSNSPWSLVESINEGEVQPLDLGPPSTSVVEAPIHSSHYYDNSTSDDQLSKLLQHLKLEYEKIAVDASALGPGAAASIILPFVNPGLRQTAADISPSFSSSMSITPTYHWNPGTLSQLQWDALPDAVETILKNTKGGARLQLYPASFLLHSIRACLLENQDLIDDANTALDQAMHAFRNLLLWQLEDSLCTLSGLVSIFESYGQRNASRKLLERVGDILHVRARVMGNLGRDPLCETVWFMRTSQVPEYGVSAEYNMGVLYQICKDLSQWNPPIPKLLLMARYNAAWAELEMGHHETARESLVNLEGPTETAFGRWHLQTISCKATLARAYFRCEQSGNAQSIMQESVVPRIEKMFSTSHPFYWEVRWRQACFMKAFSEQEDDPEEKAVMRQGVETMLRSVLLWRLTILGSNNPLTDSAFQTLRDLLFEDKRTDEATNLHDWCANICRRQRRQLGDARQAIPTLELRHQ